MIIGRVIGSIHSTINHPFYSTRRLLVIEKYPPGPAAGSSPSSVTAAPDYLIAVDAVDAGPGDRVLVLDEGNGARQVLDSSDGPVRSVIVGIVDHVTGLDGDYD